MIAVQDKPEFIPSHFAVKENGGVFPVRVKEIVDGFATVTTSAGKEYTVHENHLQDPEETLQQLRQDRIAFVRGHYSFELLHQTKKSQTVRCFNPGKKSSDYVLTFTSYGASCSCPAYGKNPAIPCKHLGAWIGLQEAPTVTPGPATAHETSEAGLSDSFGRTEADYEGIMPAQYDRPW